MRAAMSTFLKSANNSTSSSEEDVELRRGPWTHEEDNLLIHYIACHGEGRWNLLAKLSGLRRTGKSCRLRWLNYLKPDVKRGNLTPQEQLLILQLHSKWGNRWSKIAQHLPGRTDNEIKNYWRTRVQKQARNLKIETNSTVFQDGLRCFWIPRLLQKIERTSSSSSSSPLAVSSQNSTIPQPANHATQQLPPPPQVPEFGTSIMNETILYCSPGHEKSSIISSENCTSPSIFSSRSMTMTTSQVSEYPTSPFHAFVNNDYSTSIRGCYYLDNGCHDMGSFNLTSMSAEPINECHVDESNLVDNGLMESLWNMDELVAI